MKYDECLRLAWMWGFDFTLVFRKDGTVETTSCWTGNRGIGHIFSDEQAALRSMMGILKSTVLLNIKQVEEEKC